MFETVPVPQKGDRITAAWGASVANGVNALAPFAVSNGLARQGANGNGTEPLPQNQRVRHAPLRPWSFACTVANAGEANETRTGGWSNCILQVGYNKWLVSPDVLAALTSEATGVSYGHTVGTVNGTGTNADGDYVVEVNLVNETATIMLKTDATHTYPIDHGANIVYVDIGHVENARQTHRIPNHPVVYKYA